MSADERAEQQAAPAADVTAELVSGGPGDAVASSAPESAAAHASAASTPSAEKAFASAVAQPTVDGTSAGDAWRPGVPAVAAVQDDLTADGLLALLRAVFPSGHTLHWSACLDTLGPLAAGLPSDLTGWSEGRAWGARADVRWQPAGPERFSALYLGEPEALPKGFQTLAGDLRAVPSADAEGLFLWGSRGNDGRYRDLRLPRPLDYEALHTTAPEPRVPCRLLVDATGQVRFLRLTVEGGAE